MATRRGSKSTKRIRTQSAAADELGITARQLRNWEQEDWFPDGGRTKSGYDIALIRQAQESLGKKGSELREAAVALKMRTGEAKLERELVEVQRKQLILKREQGELVPRRAVELFASTVLTELGDWCDQLPDLLAAVVPARARKDLRKRITDELNRRREQLATRLSERAMAADLQLVDQESST
ncbi:hypothetical protein KOR42_39470 [Thalassoglobus neptunius]|uniref:Phage DNA packaging protein Nu1 n=1 Tax=Thalassoglobus neptunius TaxID=1938619 RepID=A0A5C5WFZ1_9PLAN|nr:hypothetical protein [Thalassoglobus neptunius]TWT49031.1 hypothetical protein KOR42_39470 [Thalassoglobus neptunius]